MFTEGNKYNSMLEVTARQIRSEVSTASSNIYSVIQQTATNIRSEVANVQNGLSSVIEQTASQIRTEVNNTVSNIRSSIQQQADKIALVVDGGNHIKAAEIVASINNGSSTIKLSADHIDIDGVVTALGAYDIGCGRLTVEGYSEFYKTVEIGQGIVFDQGAGMSIGNGNMHYGSYDVTWKSKTIVTYNLSDSHAFMYKSGSNTPTILGKLVTSQASSTIYYLGR